MPINICAEYPVAIHDIVIIDVWPSKAVVGQGYNITIHAMLQNLGNFTETFVVFIFCGYHKNYTLPERMSMTVNYTFKTSKLPVGRYRTWAYVPPCFGDDDPLNNLYAGETFIVTFVADINGDSEVNWKDLLILARAYGSEEGEPEYVKEADFNDDKKIDWRDLLTLARNYGKKA